jgi:hypothetical protein
MVSFILLLFFLAGFYPFLYAFRANRRWTILQAIFWALFAWIYWTMIFFYPPLESEPSQYQYLLHRYMALGLTGCASMAVLGARRPGAAAWNLVILGLFTVMMFLWLESRWAPDDLILRRVRTVFVASTIGIGVLNYLPTRLAPAAVLLGLGCGLEIFIVAGPQSLSVDFGTADPLARLMLAFVPWIAYVRMRWRPAPQSEFDQVWLDFRDRFGLVWAQRLREQFNASAAHADWSVVLRWAGLRIIPGTRPPDAQEQQAMLDNLRALMKRFQS